MDAGFEVTSPRRAMLVGASVVGSLLVGVVAVVGLLVVPLLDRVDTTLETLNSSLPILEQVGPDVDAIRNDVGEIAPDVGSLEGMVREVEAGLGTVDQSVNQLRPPLDTVDDSVQGVASQLETLDESVRRLEVSLGPLGVLPDVLEELRHTSDTIATVADHTDALSRQLGRVASSLDQVTVLLEETEQHVENLDRKTGPVLVPDSGRTAD